MNGVAVRKMSILLVEDEGELRDIVGDLLEESGYDVIPANSGKQALDYLTTATEPPALILLDLMMPLVNGWECLRTIRRDQSLSAIPVVVVTAIDRDRPSGADIVLKKPYRVDDLLAVVAHYAGRRSGSPHASP